MRLKDMKIGSQLRLGLGLLLALVAALGLLAYRQSGRLWIQTQSIYQHPLQVRRALGHCEASIIAIHRGMKDLVLADNEQEVEAVLRDIETRKADVARQLESIGRWYLGPRADLNAVADECAKWSAIREETIRLLRAGRKDEALVRTKPGGQGGAQAEAVLAQLRKVDDFARNKGDQIFLEATQQKTAMNRHTALIVMTILLLAVVVFMYLIRLIRVPLRHLTEVAGRFSEGEMDARSEYVSANELGQLSSAFNALAETVETQMRINEQAAQLAGVMLRETEARKFCRELLKTLTEHTGSQIGAVYLLNPQHTAFEHFESLGLGPDPIKSFSAVTCEGEFGAALATGKLQRVTAIPPDSQFTFTTVGGGFKPREIITLPLFTEGRVSAVLSFASLRDYTPEALRLLEVTQSMVAARMHGVLAFRKIQELANKLEGQNRELDAQKQELATQTRELTQQNTELEMQKQQLDEANRMKTAFLSNMSHELRTPLNSVIALSSVLERRLAGVIPEEEHSYLDVIGRNGKHLLSLINDILDLARIEAGREELFPSRFSLRGLVGEVVAMIEPQAREKGIVLLNLVEDEQQPILSDPEKCRHILQNLVSNAVKFTDTGSVEISARWEGATVRVAVRDTGIGIAADQVMLIFEEFRQADASASRKHGGTGLGLAIAKRYALLLQGDVTVESELGKGSTFTLTLPLALVLPESEAEVGEDVSCRAVSGQRVAVPGQGQTLLLVEDSEPAIIQMTDILTRDGYRVQVARNGREGLAHIAQALPDGMILDLMMPEMDGFEVLRTIRGTEKANRLPVLILTAKHVTREELSFLKGNHIHQLIQKGDVSRKELLAAVATMVRPPQEKAAAPAAARRKAPHTRKPRVLVVEDNSDNLSTMRALLQETCTVLEAADGRAGVEQARAHQPDLILMDLAMPIMDGYAAYDVIRKDAALCTIPVVAVTASAMSGNREAIMAYGFDGYISKPVDEQVLRETLREVLYGHA